MRGCVNRPGGLIYTASFLVYNIEYNFLISLNLKITLAKTKVRLSLD